MPIRTEMLRLVAACMVLAASAYAQEAERFVGKWEGEHRGQKHLVMTVAAGAPLKITFTTAEIHVGETGEIDEIRGAVENVEEVIESSIENGRLLFRTRQHGGDEVSNEMRVENDRAALLRLVDEPDWVKPFRLKRS